MSLKRVDEMVALDTQCKEKLNLQQQLSAITIFKISLIFPTTYLSTYVTTSLEILYHFLNAFIMILDYNILKTYYTFAS